MEAHRGGAIDYSRRSGEWRFRINCVVLCTKLMVMGICGGGKSKVIDNVLFMTLDAFRDRKSFSMCSGHCRTVVAHDITGRLRISGHFQASIHLHELL